MNGLNTHTPVERTIVAASVFRRHPESDLIFALRRYLIGFLFIAAYVISDRSTVFFQIWSGISAWYPPTGLALALLIGMGIRFAPMYLLASLIASTLNYHQLIFSYGFLLGNLLVICTYTAATVALDRFFAIDWRLASIRDVMSLLFVALPSSCIVAFVRTEQALQPVVPLAQEKGIELVWNVCRIPTMVSGDYGRLRQVLIKLIGNALKFTKEGEVTVLAELSTKSESEIRVHFTISDTGIGIPFEKQRKIFEAFAQADMSISGRYGGTGLGLSISERLVKLMNGRIWLESEVGHGSQFHFEIPFLPAGIRLTQPNSGPLPQQLVLVADDNSVNLEMIRRVLSEWGVESIVAFGGCDALATFEDHSRRGVAFSAALIDTDMRDLSGLELASLISASATPPAHVVLMLHSPLDARSGNEL
jgi:CheY-like chemotaxis protein